MHFSKITLLIAGAGLCQALFIKRDIATINTDFDNLTADVAKFNSSVTAFDGTFGTVGAVASSGQKLNADVKTTTDDITASDPFSVEDSAALATRANATAADVVSTLANLAASEPKFKLLGADSLVAGQLETLKAAADNFSDALLGKAQDTDRPIYQAAKDAIEAQYKTTHDTFQPPAPATPPTTPA